MQKSVRSIQNMGAVGAIVEIECHLSKGLPGITIVGLGNKAIDESKERIRSAFASSNITLPRKRIVINLAPADLPKESTSFDLAIALAIMQAAGQLKITLDDTTAIIGELGLAGDVRAVRGVIGKILAAKSHGICSFYIPSANVLQAKLIPNISITPINNIYEAYENLSAIKTIPQILTGDGIGIEGDSALQKDMDCTFADINGQEHAKRALEIAAAGGHNILLSGPPGTGKSMLAKALINILPPLNRQEMLEITQLHSLVGGRYDQLVIHHPFRSPHHSSSHIAIVGGGQNLKPGEISLAHRGVLFLDELPEFSRMTVEALRQPLEDMTITISRAKESATYPACFILVATANPCPCGNYGSNKECVCPPHRVSQYRQKLSGPILDRIDLYVDVDAVDHSTLLSQGNINTHVIHARDVAVARDIQAKRYNSHTILNAHVSNRQLKTTIMMTAEAKKLLDDAAEKLGLSGRGYIRTARVARTIADLSKTNEILPEHVSEALRYRAHSS